MKSNRAQKGGSGPKDLGAGLKYSHQSQNINVFEEGVEFLPANNSRKVEKRGPKRWIVLLALVIFFILLSLMVGILVWHFNYQNVRVQKIFNGYLRITNENFIDAYENSNSTEFAHLANKVKEALKVLYNGIPALGPFYKESGITAFSEGSVIAYYWSEFSVPQYKAEEVERAISKEYVLSLPPRSRALQSFNVASIVAFPTDARTLQTTRDNSCSFSLHARADEVTRFTTPGFPDSPYPARARCQWALRGDVGLILSLTFHTFDVAPCDDVGSDVVMVYDSLSPVEPRAVVQLCGTYPPSYNLTFLSSQNVMLVTLITNTVRRHPGFKAEFFQLSKMTECGGRLTGVQGTFSTPYYPGHYPPNIDCTWDIEVPTDQNVKVRFKLFYLVEPHKTLGTCTKDYVEINGEKFCGEKPQFVVSSNSNKITVHFHSDESYTDTGFFAEYLSYDSSDPCPGMFTCKSGRCINNTLRCDGWADCTDFSDELQCVCNSTFQFTCKNEFCKPLFWVCDGLNDCGDNSDELQCSCPDGNFRCGNGKCIPESQKCDKQNNCGDWSDEAECDSVSTIPCTKYTYKCLNGLCLSKRNPECDGKKDCSDGSDEKNCDCGLRSFSRQARIVGGQNSDEGEWPWQVSLHAEGEGHLCGASLISSTWLVSAAHCFVDDSGIRYSEPTQWKAFLGLHDQSKRSVKGVQERGFKQIIPHAAFNDLTFDYDIAVLELDKPVQFSSVIRPICLPDSSHTFPAGKAIWVTGWGHTKEGGTGALILQKGEIRVINQTTCESLLPNQVTPRMMCVGFLNGGVDACQGDSGGPLSSVENDGRMFLAGVVSWGDGCARRNKPGVYTRIPILRDWIKEQTGV
ncbi:suppressor of tumorigenicity 14 protein [Sminthopsis crassicaudata]|uniref:suppressor of tumorigenicity 14 protein n=1 Tax=Sminthopsis crassicaudata TaxID=9301 RepID=UPI003D69C46C